MEGSGLRRLRAWAGYDHQDFSEAEPAWCSRLLCPVLQQPDEAKGEIHSLSSPCKLASIKITLLSPVPHISVASELPGFRPGCPQPHSPGLREGPPLFDALSYLFILCRWDPFLPWLLFMETVPKISAFLFSPCSSC